MARRLETVKASDIDDSTYQMRLSVQDESYVELAASIRRDGVLVPILLSELAGHLAIIAGHRRFKAVLEIGLKEVPAYVFSADEEKGWTGAFAENMFRQDLSPIEEAAAVVDCLKAGEFDIHRLAIALGKSAQWVEDRVTVAAWPEAVQIGVHQGRISLAAARNLVKVEDPVHRQMLLEYAYENGVTARVTAAWLQAWQAGQVNVAPADIPADQGGARLPPIEPYSPCVICGRKLKMIELHYTPVCNDCTPIILDVARELAAGAAGSG